MEDIKTIAIIRGRLVLLKIGSSNSSDLRKLLYSSHFFFIKERDGSFSIIKNRETGILGNLPDFNSVMNFIDDLQDSWVTKDKPVTDYLQAYQLTL